jgi:hypothetical protein
VSIAALIAAIGFNYALLAVIVIASVMGPTVVIVLSLLAPLISGLLVVAIAPTL